MVGYRVVASLDGYGGLLVRCALKQVEASKVTWKVQHALHIPAQGLLLVARGDADALLIDIVAMRLSHCCALCMESKSTRVVKARPLT